MYVGSTDTAIISAMTTHSPLPTTIGCSWGWTPADPSTLDPYFQKMAAQGQNFFAASGDSSTWSTRNEAWPADDAYVVSVGGTDLVTASAGGPWKSETAWSDSGGGISPDKIAIPSWQQLSGVINSSNKGSTTLRNGPDVSANANFTFYTCADQTTCLANEYGGTSFAAPMWAGYIALVNQQLAANGELDHRLHQPDHLRAERDVQLWRGFPRHHQRHIRQLFGSNRLRPGHRLGQPERRPDRCAHWIFDTDSGLHALASPTAVSVAAGSNGTSTITTAVSGGFNSAIALTASGAPTGVTVSFNPTLHRCARIGHFHRDLHRCLHHDRRHLSITITGTGGGLTHTATVSLTVTSGVSAGFTISASPNSISVDRNSSGTATITTAVSGGFSSAITLSASGQGSGQTVTFNPTSIASPGTGTSTMTVKVGRRPTGNRTITITATGGGKKETTTVTLDVIRSSF